MRVLSLSAAIAVAVLSFASAANATFTVYTSQSAFLAALNAEGEDTFNNLSASIDNGVLSTNRTAGAFSYTANSSDFAPGYSTMWRAGTSKDYYLATGVGGDVLYFTNFSSGVNAVGGYFFTTDDAGLPISRPLGLTLLAEGSNGVLSPIESVDTMIEMFPNATTKTFIGVISTDGFKEFELSFYSFGDDPADYQGRTFVTANNLYLGTATVVTPVPEPSSLALILTGCGALGVSLRARRNKP